MSKRVRADVVDMVSRLELVLPIPVAVVGFGKKHDTVTGAWLAAMQDYVHYVDLRTRLPEQSQDRVLHGQDASHTKTQIAVYSQSGFADVITESIEESLGRAMATRTGFIVAGECNTACHRADTFRQTLRDCLNSIHCGDVKVFNAQYFSLHEAGSSVEQKYVLEQAVLWSTRPWTNIDQPAVFDRFARKAVALRSESQWSYETVWQFVDEELSGDAWHKDGERIRSTADSESTTDPGCAQSTATAAEAESDRTRPIVTKASCTAIIRAASRFHGRGFVRIYR